MRNRKSSKGNPGNSSNSNNITEGFHFYYFKVILRLKTSEVLCVSCPSEAFVSVQLRLFQFTSVHFNSLCFTWKWLTQGAASSYLLSSSWTPTGVLLHHQQLHLQPKEKQSQCVCMSVCASVKRNYKSRQDIGVGKVRFSPCPLLLPLSIHLLCFLLLNFLSQAPPASSDCCVMQASPGNLLLRKDGWRAWGWVGGLLTLSVENVKHKMLQSPSAWWFLN